MRLYVESGQLPKWKKRGKRVNPFMEALTTVVQIIHVFLVATVSVGCLAIAQHVHIGAWILLGLFGVPWVLGSNKLLRPIYYRHRGIL